MQREKNLHPITALIQLLPAQSKSSSLKHQAGKSERQQESEEKPTYPQLTSFLWEN